MLLEMFNRNFETEWVWNDWDGGEEEEEEEEEMGKLKIEAVLKSVLSFLAFDITHYSTVTHVRVLSRLEF